MFPVNLSTRLIVILAQAVSFGGFLGLLTAGLPVSAAPAQHSHQTIHKDGLSVHTVGHATHGGHHTAHSVVAPIHHAGFHGHHAPHHAVHHAPHHQAVHHQAVHHQAVHHAEPVAQAYQPTEDVVDIAVGNKDFSTLVKIVSDLGLVETLKNAEAVTIFAPNDAAFAKLPAGTLESLTPEQVNVNSFYLI